MTNYSALELNPGDVLDSSTNGDALPIGTIAETIPHWASYWVKTARGCWASIYRHTSTRAEIKQARRERALHASPMFGNERLPIRIVSVPKPWRGKDL